mgnify:CR=1 FL=1
MTAEQRAGLSDAALAMTQPCIDELIKDISRRVQKAGAITDTAEYQLYRAQALGESKKAIEQAVSKQIGISEEVIASLFEYVADKSLGLDENGSLKRMTEAYTRMTQSKTRELLRDLWADTPEGKVQPLQTAYARAMDFAFRQVATGTLDLDTAIRRAVTPLAKRGLRTIEQKSGRSVGIEYACRRYIMDQLGQLDDEIQRADHDALGCDGWEISAHAACAPDHEPIQGRQYGDAEFEKLNNSLQRRIGHLNCGHTANPIILGVNAPQYTEAQLQKFKDDNGRGVVYNGYRYTLYEAGQEQSRIENGIRLIKRQILADEETESPDLQKHQIKLRVVQAEYARFCKAVGLPTRSERRGQRPRSKTMTSYEFYVCKYGGKAIQPDEWRTAYADADALIQRYERLYRVGYPTDSARDTAVCAIADAQRRFADVQSGAVAAPASVTIGSVSESYTANTAAAIDATPKAQAAEYYRILCLYADVYRGCS